MLAVVVLASLVTQVWLVVIGGTDVSAATVGWAFLWPVAWICYTFARGAVTGWYPYPFLDVTELGYPTVLRHTALVPLVAAGLAALLRLLDHRLPALGVRGEPLVDDRPQAGG